jgi:hypothetical protein
MGWAAKARASHERGDDRPLDSETSTQFDRRDWHW